MSTITKKAARKEVTALVTDNMSATIEAALDHIPNSFDGQSPVVTVPSGSTNPAFNLNTQDNTAQFEVTVWSLRIDEANSITREAAAEDDIDDFSDSFVAQIETWDNGEFARPSAPDYGIIDGLQYRTDTHFVSVNLER